MQVSRFRVIATLTIAFWVLPDANALRVIDEPSLFGPGEPTSISTTWTPSLDLVTAAIVQGVTRVVGFPPTGPPVDVQLSYSGTPLDAEIVRWLPSRHDLAQLVVAGRAYDGLDYAVAMQLDLSGPDPILVEESRVQVELGQPDERVVVAFTTGQVVIVVVDDSTIRIVFRDAAQFRSVVLPNNLNPVAQSWEVESVSPVGPTDLVLSLEAATPTGDIRHLLRVDLETGASYSTVAPAGGVKPVILPIGSATVVIVGDSAGSSGFRSDPFWAQIPVAGALTTGRGIAYPGVGASETSVPLLLFGSDGLHLFDLDANLIGNIGLLHAGDVVAVSSIPSSIDEALVAVQLADGSVLGSTLVLSSRSVGPWAPIEERYGVGPIVIPSTFLGDVGGLYGEPQRIVAASTGVPTPGDAPTTRVGVPPLTTTESAVLDLVIDSEDTFVLSGGGATLIRSSDAAFLIESSRIVDANAGQLVTAYVVQTDTGLRIVAEEL